ncbi:MAG TPA: outer membrane protein transport protein [Kofleriaceae bacterium]
MKTLRTALFLAVGLGGGVASANGFYLNEHDAKVTGRGGAATATNVDPSAIVYNPGGIPVAEGTAVSIGSSLIIAKGSYTDLMDNKTDTDSSPAVLPSIFITSRVHEMVSVGLGFHLPFGLAVSWPDNHAQADVIQDQALRTYFITPAFGINLNKQVPGLTIGGGIDLVPATVELESAVVFGETRGTAHLGGDAFGVGGRIGVMYTPEAAPQLHIGAMYRHSVKLDFTGNGDFDIADPYRNQLPEDGEISTSITLPSAFSLGVAYDATPELNLELDGVYQTWSKFDTLTIDLPGDAETVSPQDYEDKLTIRFGAEYKVAPMAAVRAGYIYDPTPVPGTTISARLPDANRHDITVGGSYSFGNYDVNLGLLYVLPGSQETSMSDDYEPQFKGTYKVTAFVASLGLQGRFGN